MKSHLWALIGLGLAAAAGPALAHHSSANYDRDRAVILKGEVKDLRWANPHSYIQLTAQNARGASENWTIELESPSVMVREGWSLLSVLPGDEVTARVMPLRDGRPGARLIELTRADGTAFHLFTPRGA